MMFVVAVLGAIGFVVLGLLGLMRGEAGQFEQILAIAFFAMAAAGVVGMLASTPNPPSERPRRLSLGGAIMGVAIIPAMAISVGFFLLTLIPSVYVMLPFFAVWWLGSESRRSRRVEPMAAHPGLPEPITV
jgi:hypothetical protein